MLERGRSRRPTRWPRPRRCSSTRSACVGYSVVRIVSPVFYALGHNRTPVIVSVVTVLVNAALNFVLVRVLGYRGLALGTSIAALFNAGDAARICCAAHLHGLNERRLLGAVARIMVASVAMGAAACSRMALETLAVRSQRSSSQIVRLAVAIGVALMVLAAARLAAPHSRVQRRRRARHATAPPHGAMKRRPFGFIPPSCCSRRRTSSSTATATSSRRCCRCSSPISVSRCSPRARCRCVFSWRTRSASSPSATSPTGGGRACCCSPGRSSASRSCR